MFVRDLTLTNFRNFRQQEISLPPGPVLILGGNAQGKTNLLEALFLLATTRSPRALRDSELIHWDAHLDPQPIARVLAEAQRRAGSVQVEVVVVGRPGTGQGRPFSVNASKRLRVNGVPRRQADVIGQINAVLFTSQDLELVSGPPALRRRFLDLTLSQVDRTYLGSLQRYAKVLTQRNALLRRIQDGEASIDELAFWDRQMAEYGGRIMAARARAVPLLADSGAEIHRGLSGGQETLGLAYEPRLPTAREGQRAASVAEAEVAEALHQGMRSGRRREIAAGASLYGPHRDDLALTLDGLSAASFASRGQQRTAVLALRLAEARFLLDRTGDYPLLLLDDVLSELDEERRAGVLEAMRSFEQVLITSADADRFDEGLLGSAAMFRVTAGCLEQLR
jgi:DNA replication and repair protein RecF